MPTKRPKPYNRLNRPFTWNIKREAAAGYVAEGVLSAPEIAKRLGCALRTVHGWKRHPAFKQRVADLTDNARQIIAQSTVATYQGRIDFRLKLAEKVAGVVEQITSHQFSELKEKPIASINLALKLLDTMDRLLGNDQEKSSLGELPDIGDFSPAALQEVFRIIAEAHAGASSEPEERAADAGGIHRANDGLQAP